MGGRKQSCQLLCGEKGEAGRLKLQAENKVADCVREATGSSSLLEHKARDTILSGGGGLKAFGSK